MENFKFKLEGGAEVELTEKDAKGIFKSCMAMYVADGLRNMSEENSYLYRPLSEALVRGLADGAVGHFEMAEDCGESYFDAVAYDMIVRSIVGWKEQLSCSTLEELLEEWGSDNDDYAIGLKEFDDRFGEFRKWNEDDMVVRLGEGSETFR